MSERRFKTLKCHNLNGAWYFTLLSLIYKFNTTNNIQREAFKTLKCQDPNGSWYFTLLSLIYKFNTTNNIQRVAF